MYEKCSHGVVLMDGWECVKCKKTSVSEVALSDLVNPLECLEYILNNVDLFIEWCQEGRTPVDFLMAMPGEITEEDIKWAEESLKKRAG